MPDQQEYGFAIADAAARTERCWREGIAFLRRTRGGAARPWLLSFGHETAGRRHLLASAELSGTGMTASVRNPAFTWHFAQKAVWLDVPEAFSPERDDVRKSLFRLLAARKPPLAGAVLTLDAVRILSYRETDRRREAGRLRQLLDDVGKSVGSLPVYILVSHIDRLFGIRACAARTDRKALRAPLGAFRTDLHADPAFFAEQTLAAAARTVSVLSRTAADASPPPLQEAAAVIHAPLELRRLGTALGAFCGEAFGENPYFAPADLGGVFLVSAGCDDGSASVPNISLSGTAGWNAEEAAAESWFAAELLADRLPRAPRRTMARGSRFGAGALVCGMLILCALLTGSYFESRNILRSAAHAMSRTAADRKAGWFLEYAERLKDGDSRRVLPRFGLHSVGRTERKMRRRFCEIYESEEIRAFLGEIHSLAASAEQSGDALTIGGMVQTLSFLAGGPDAPPEELPGHAEHMASGFRMFRAYRLWSEDPAAEQELAEVFSEIERGLVSRAENGRVMAWLPEWAAAQGGRENLPVSWSPAGYAAAGKLLGTESPSVSEYRRQALAAWKARAEAVWTGKLEAIRDSELPARLRDAAAGTDPAMDLLREIRDHLLPMFPEPDTDPDIAWLRQYSALIPDTPGSRKAELPESPAVTYVLPVRHGQAAGQNPSPFPADHAVYFSRFREAQREIAARCADPEAGVELVREQYRGTPAAANPFSKAQQAADGLAASLRETAGGPGWSSLSPAASYHYTRYLAVRLAAVRLNEKWRSTVYHAAPILRSRKESKEPEAAELINAFLAESSGLWVQGADKEFRNAVWDRMPFFFTPEFLELCTGAAAVTNRTRPAKLTVPFRAEAVLVNPGARAHPVKVDFIWGGTKIPQLFEFRNFSSRCAFVWEDDLRGPAEIRVHFPSFTIRKHITGESALSDFVRLFENGTHVLHASEFPEAREALAEIGVSHIELWAAAFGHEDFLLFYDKETLKLSRDIITRGGRGPAPAGSVPEQTAPEEKYSVPAAGIRAISLP